MKIITLSSYLYLINGVYRANPIYWITADDVLDTFYKLNGAINEANPFASR